MALQGCVGGKDARAAFSIAKFKLFESGLEGDEFGVEMDRLWKIRHGHRLVSKTPKRRINHSNLPPDEKWCNGCEKSKPRAAFSVDRSRKDGLNNRCRDCAAGYFKETQSRRCDKCDMRCIGKTCERCYRLRIVIRDADTIVGLIPQMLLRWRDENLSVEAHKVYRKAVNLRERSHGLYLPIRH